MHLLAPADKVVLPKSSFLFRRHDQYAVLVRRKNKQKKSTAAIGV
jgi:hypothetical protein